MPKTYKLDAEKRSTFLTPVESQGEMDQKGERDNTSPLIGARLIDIERIKPDPNQPRKTFEQRTLESLAESIKEIGGIIDPLTVAYDDRENVFRIVSGERRYRAATMAGLERLPCIIKEGDQEKTLLLQLIANLQREDMTALEESAGIRSLIEKFSYSQAEVAKLLNKSQSYVSQILGLEDLAQPAREILQTSKVAKEVQLQASREKDPEKQSEILRKASEEGKTVRQIRQDAKMAKLKEAQNPSRDTGAEESPDEIKGKNFRKWTWRPEDGRFAVTIQFRKEQRERGKVQLVKAALEETLKYVNESTPGNSQ